MTDIALRPMRASDLAVVLELEQALFEDAWSLALFRSELAERASRTYIVALADDEVVGYGGLAAYPDEAFVQTLAVAPAFQRRGIATRLLLALIRDARARGLDRIGLEVRIDNGAAQHLYGRFGLEPVAVRKRYYQPSGTDALVMLASGVASPDYAGLLADIEAALP